jgi:DDE superfamily endonuclease
MEELRSLCTKFELRNILNMDKTSLNWKRTPNRSLATKSQNGTKQSKDRITVVLTSNADGSKKFEPWIISRSQKPCLFLQNQPSKPTDYLSI